MEDADGQRLVHFPPHTATQIVALVPKGARAILLVRRQPHPGDGPRGISLVAVLRQGQAAVQVPAIPPPRPAAGRAVTLHGPFEVRNGPDGPAGWTQADRWVPLPRPARPVLEPLLRDAKTVVTHGYERDSAAGFVNIQGFPVVKPDQVTIDGNRYDVR